MRRVTRRCVKCIPRGVDSLNTPDTLTITGLDQVPEHLLLAGGSTMGLAFAQTMRRFGSAPR
jgi:pyruvate/2-oxoglutarate dehydrogenase complex dihydrolipoamide dehydrogenase (E3) component